MPLIENIARDAGRGRCIGVELQPFEARGSDELERAFAAMAKAGAGAVLVLPDQIILFNSARIVDLAEKSRLPAMYGPKEFVAAGGLMAYGPNYVDLYRRTATYVDKILKGAKPGDLAVEQPTKFELVVNVKAAKALGLTLPPTLLSRAEELIE